MEEGRRFRHSREVSALDYRRARRSTGSNFSYGSRDEHRYAFNDGGPSTPPLLSSPSAASSIGGVSNSMSPLRRELSRSTLHDDPRNVSSSPSKLELARRLSDLAQHLTRDDDEVDDMALMNEVDEMAKVVAQSPSLKGHRRPESFDIRSLSGYGGSVQGSPSPSLFRSRLSDLSSEYMAKEPEPEPELEPEPDDTQETPKMGMSVRQANKVIAEATKLNEELSVVVANLQARQEESDHIHGLLVERAERAAQRIIFLQNRISYLEQELEENDDELQHLRISLKAIEVQLPPHPDRELQRCIANFKKDYQALKKKRASRNSLPAYDSLDSSRAEMSFSTPARTPAR